MKDEKTKEKEVQIIQLVNSFCMENLNEEYNEICVNLVKKLGRKHNVPFKRGKLEIWASSIIYAIAQINFLFDKSSTIHITPDTICNFFNTNKSTVSNKAHTIRDMCNLGPFDKEFSPDYILDSIPNAVVDPDSGLIIPIDNDYFDDLDNGEDEINSFFDNVYKLVEKDEIDEALKLLDSIAENDSEYLHARFYKHFIENFRDKGLNGKFIGDFVPDEDFILNILGSTFEDVDYIFSDEYVELESRINSPYSLKYAYEELDDDFRYSEVLLPHAIFQVCDWMDFSDDLDDVVLDVGEDFGIEPNVLKDIVIGENYIIDNSNDDYIIGKLKTYNPKQLKKILREHKLKRSGSKDELIKRLLDNVPKFELPFSIYELTDKGKDLINDSEREFFSEHLNKYSYAEFKEYYPDGDFKTNLIGFFNKHKALSKKREDYFGYLNASYSIANVYYSMEDFSNAVYNIIENLIFDINCIYLDEKFYDYYAPLNIDVCSLLHFTSQILSFNDIENIFNKICEDFEFEFKIPKEIIWEIIKNIVNGLEFQDILDGAIKKYIIIDK